MAGQHRAPLGEGQHDRLRFLPAGGSDLAPSGARARYASNVAAIRVLRMLDDEQRPATSAEQRVLAGWSSWGAVPEVFDESKTDWSAQRAELQSLLSADEWGQARRTTLSAHYTSPDYVEAVWEAVAALGFDGGEVLEPAFMRKSDVSRDIEWSSLEQLGLVA